MPYQAFLNGRPVTGKRPRADMFEAERRVHEAFGKAYPSSKTNVFEVRKVEGYKKKPFGGMLQD